MRDEAMLALIKLDETAPNFAIQAAKLKGKVEAIREIWAKRDLIRKSKPTKKGKPNAYQEEPEADEDEFELEDY
ncbi:MAG TPA: hypothetical protein VFW62_01550 [bacterium]|nr:hypothetical protein [bacterium]